MKLFCGTAARVYFWVPASATTSAAAAELWLNFVLLEAFRPDPIMLYWLYCIWNFWLLRKEKRASASATVTSFLFSQGLNFGGVSISLLLHEEPKNYIGLWLLTAALGIYLAIRWAFLLLLVYYSEVTICEEELFDLFLPLCLSLLLLRLFSEETPLRFDRICFSWLDIVWLD